MFLFDQPYSPESVHIGVDRQLSQFSTNGRESNPAHRVSK